MYSLKKYRPSCLCNERSMELQQFTANMFRVYMKLPGILDLHGLHSRNGRNNGYGERGTFF